MLLATDHGNLHQTASQLHRQADGHLKPMLNARLDQKPVDYNLDCVILPFIKVYLVIQVHEFAVNPRSRIPVLDQRLHFLLELALAPPDDRGHHHDTVFRRKRHDLLDNLVSGLSADRSSALGTMRHSDRSEEQAKVIVDLGDRSDSRSGAAASSLLLDRDGRAKSIDCIDIRTFHLIQKLPRIGRQSLNIASLALGINRVKSQRRFPRAAQPGDNGESVTWNLHVDVFQIVLPGAPDRDLRNRHYLPGVVSLP